MERTVGDVSNLGAGTLGDDELLLGGRGDRVDLDGRLTFALLAGFLCHLACDSMESGLMLLFGLNTTRQTKIRRHTRVFQCPARAVNSFVVLSHLVNQLVQFLQ